MKTSLYIIITILIVGVLGLGVFMLQKNVFDAKLASYVGFEDKFVDKYSNQEDDIASLESKVATLSQQNTALLSQLSSLHTLISANYCYLYPQTKVYLSNSQLLVCNAPKLQEPHYVLISSSDTAQVALHRVSDLTKQVQVTPTIPFVEDQEYIITVRVDDGDGVYTVDKDLVYPEYSQIFSVKDGQVVIQ